MSGYNFLDIAHVMEGLTTIHNGEYIESPHVPTMDSLVKTGHFGSYFFMRTIQNSSLYRDRNKDIVWVRKTDG